MCMMKVSDVNIRDRPFNLKEGEAMVFLGNLFSVSNCDGQIFVVFIMGRTNYYENTLCLKNNNVAKKNTPLRCEAKRN